MEDVNEFQYRDLGKYLASPDCSTTSDSLKALKRLYLWKVYQQDFPSLGSVPSTEAKLKQEC